MWQEVIFKKINKSLTSLNTIENKDIYWVPLDKGGSYRKWYGNKNYIVWWKNDGEDIKKCKKSAVRSPQYFFTPHISWTLISSSCFSARYFDTGFALDTASNCIYFKDNEIKINVLAFLNSKIADDYLQVMNPTMNFSCGIIGHLPYKIENEKDSLINNFVTNNIKESKSDWDSFEASWDFKVHPLIKTIQTQ